MTKKLKDIVKESFINVDENSVSKKDIEYLIKETFSLTHTDFILKQDEMFSDELLYSKLEELKKGKPVEYVLGYSYFCLNKFEVNENTLIPRSETEDLVYRTLELIKETKINKPRILDIGSGSGCIPITIYKMIETLKIDSVDISLKALEICKRNNELNNTKVNFFQSDCFENINDKYDLIISNPPYIDEDTYVQESVLKYEPHTALFADNHGLAIYERIIANIEKYISRPGLAAFEISPDLVDRLSLLVNNQLINVDYYFEKDINGFDRFLFIKFKK